MFLLNQTHCQPSCHFPRGEALLTFSFHVVVTYFSSVIISEVHKITTQVLSHMLPCWVAARTICVEWLLGLFVDKYQAIGHSWYMAKSGPVPPCSSGPWSRKLGRCKLVSIKFWSSSCYDFSVLELIFCQSVTGWRNRAGSSMRIRTRQSCCGGQ